MSSDRTAIPRPLNRAAWLITILTAGLPLAECGGGSGSGGGSGGSNTGGPNAGGASTMGGASATGGAKGGGGVSGSGGSSSASQTGGAVGACTSVASCGNGSLVGAWSVESSCLTVSGTLDPSAVNLSCSSAPVTGSLAVTGTLTVNSDGSYSDHTVISGTEQFTLAASCLVISSTPVGCDQAGNIVQNLGFHSASCTAAQGGGCSCAGTVQQPGGVGIVSGDVSATGSYTTANQTLTLAGTTSSTDLSYSYCVAGATLSMTPQSTSPILTGTIAFTKQSGGGSGGAGGMPGSGEGGSGASGGGSGASGGAGSGGAPGAGGASSAGGGTGSGGSSALDGWAGNSTGPCDILAAANTPCVAAHSTVRALFGSYSKPLYQVRRASDGTTQDISLLAGTGIADAAAQDAFCGTTSKACTISTIYDQTGNGNDLTAAQMCSTCSGCPGNSSKTGQPDIEAYADLAKISISGHPAYGVHILPCGNGIPNQTGYRCDTTKKTATGDQPESVYAVLDGTASNSGCCFDYGNASTTNTASGNMDAVEFSSNKYWGFGAGSGPWVGADLEAGIYTWNGASGNWENPNSTSLAYPFVTAILKNNQNGQTGGPFVLEGGDARSGTLTTMWNGARPNGYSTLNKGGGIVLGMGGDGAAGASGNFFEGAMTASFNSSTTDAALQANIVAAGYGK